MNAHPCRCGHGRLDHRGLWCGREWRPGLADCHVWGCGCVQYRGENV